MDLGGGMLAAPAPGSALRLCFERVVSLDSPAPGPGGAGGESQEAAALPDPLDAPSFRLLDAAPSLSQDAGLFCTPDFITPQDHQFACAYATAEKENQLRQSPGSPLRGKRPRRDGFDSGGEDEPPCVSQPASQGAPGGDAGRPPRHPGNTPFALGSRGLGAPPHAAGAASRRAHILSLRHATQSPPSHRNAFLAGEEGEAAGSSASAAERDEALCRAGSGASRYRADFHQVRLLGRGSFASVHEVRSRLDGCAYAVKRTTRPLLTAAARRAALAEVHALAAAGAHPNLTRYFGAWFEGDALYIQLELCAGGALTSLAPGVSRPPLPEADVADVLRCCAAALAHLHGRGIAHLDVKPDNILACGGRRYALGDLGTAAALRGGGAPPNEGDARYLPAELLNGCYGALDRADVFSLGASGYELARGLGLPKHGDEYAALRRGQLQLLPGVSVQLQALLARCMHAFPAQRPAAEAVAESPALLPRARDRAAAAEDMMA